MGSRRGHNEGSIYQREDGRWCASVHIGYRKGKRRRKTVYGRTRREVAEKLKALQRDQSNGINILPDQQTIKEFLEYWLEHLVKPARKESTYESYERIIRLYIVPHVGHYKLSKLTPQHAQMMLADLHASGLSARTVQYAQTVLGRALSQAMKWDLVPRNVATLVERPRGQKRPIAPLTLEQAQQLLDAARGHQLEALFRVTLSLGLRRGEVLALRWQDINFEARTLIVSGSLQRYRSGLKRSEPKTKSSQRTLPLSPSLIEALQAHQAEQEIDRAFHGDEWVESGYVFTSSIGTPMEPRNLLRYFKQLLEQAGLPHEVRFHDLRHSCATFLIAQNVHPRVIMEILGHSQINITMDIYAHVLPETTRAATDKLDALFPAEK